MTEGSTDSGFQLVLGSPAALEAALTSRVRELRARDPLAPIVALVGGILQRPYLARLLATELGGIVNVRLLTVGELGLTLGEPALAGCDRKPLQALGERVLVAELAREAGGYFEPVAETPGFADALRRLLRELRQEGIDPEPFREALPGVAEPDRKADSLATTYERYAQARAGFYNGDDCLRHADPDRLEACGVLVTGIERLAGVARGLLERIASRVPVGVYLPELGEIPDAAHAELRAWLVGAGATVERLPEPEPAGALDHLKARLFRPDGAAEPDGSARLLSAPDPAAEVREAARACLEWAAEGIDFREMAVAYRQAGAYRPLVEAVFAEAGIPVYLHDGASLAERPIGRRTLALLDLFGTPLRRRDVMRFVTDGRLPRETAERYGGGSTARWDDLSRRAGVVEGIGQWRERLGRYRDAQSDRYGDEPPEWLDERLAAIDGLVAFVGDLHDRLAANPGRASWSAHLDHLDGLLRDYVPDGEQIAGYLDGLRRLDELLPEVDSERFLAVVRTEIENLRTTDLEEGRQGAFGRRGVNVLDANQLRHLRFRAVCVLGLAERAFPPPPAQDPLLLDEERLRLRGAFPGFPLRARGADPEPLQFALAVHAARERLLLGYPRAEDSGGRARLPSPFFRAAARALVGEQVTATEIDALPAGLFTRHPAGKVGAGDPKRALSESEWDRTLLEECPALGRAMLLETAPPFARAVLARRSRWLSRTLTPFDGALGTDEALAALAAHVARTLAPTNLEIYATCPHRYFLGNVLSLGPVEEPEALQRIAANEKGSAVHAILERFLAELGDEGASSATHDEHLARLRAIADEELARVEAGGLTGYPLLWGYDRKLILEDLDAWLRDELDSGAGFTRRAYEVTFGQTWREPGPDDLAEPVAIELESGTVRFHGRIDRVEWTPGAGFRVVDYKTGRAYGKATATLEGGRRLQLPVYLLAGQLIAEAPLERGRAEYLYASRRARFRRVGMDGSYLAERMDALRDVLGRIVGGIAGGDFHLEPGESECRWCDFDGVCPIARNRLAERKADDPRVVSFRKLREIK